MNQGNCKYSPKGKAIIAIVCGLVSLFLSPFGFNGDMNGITISISWVTIFPLVISLAYGWRYGLITALSGAIYFPFVLWPNNGFGNALTAFNYLLIFTLIGNFNKPQPNAHNRKVFTRLAAVIGLCGLLFAIQFYVLFNPILSLNLKFDIKNSIHHLEHSILSAIILKELLSIILFIIVAETLLHLSWIRRLLGFPAQPFMRNNGRVLSATLLSSIFIWLVLIGLQYILNNHESGLTFNHSLITFIVIMVSSVFVARVIMQVEETQLVIEETLIENEQNLKIQFELIPDACIVWNADLTIKTWNPSAERIFGFTSMEVIGKKANETFLLNDVNLDDIWNHLLVKNEPAKSVNNNITKSGKVILCEWANAPLFNTLGESIGVISIVKDITNKFETDQILEFLAHKGSSVSGKAFLDSLTIYLGNLLKVNYFIINKLSEDKETVETITLFIDGEIGSNIRYKLAGTPCANVIDQQICIYPNGVQQKFPQDTLLVNMEADGYIGIPLWDSKGKPIGLMAALNKTPLENTNHLTQILSIVATRVGVEIERMEFEKELRESEQKLSTLFESMTEMVVLHEVVFDENGNGVNYRLTDCNKAFTQITGITREQAIGKLASEVYQAEIPPYLQEFTQVVISGQPYEYTTYFAPMDKHLMISVVSPQKNTFATITTDITAILQIQEVIKTKNKELENYLFVASHDLRSPLVNIQGFSQRLQKQTDSIKEIIKTIDLNDDVKEQLDKYTLEGIPKTLDFISTNVSKMDTLINGLLQISRTGRIKLVIVKVDMNQLINSIQSALHFQLSEKSVVMTVDDLPYCYGDEIQLNQLFTNLIENAIKYSDKIRPLAITIKGKTHYKKVIYTLQDTGVGINERHIEKIWDVFYRVDSTSPQSGEGIGLSIVKRIADKHKGKIWVQSEPQVGSVFSIELQRVSFIE